MAKVSAVVLLSTILALSVVCRDASGARVLAVIPTMVKSHFGMVEPYLKALAARGHQLVVLSQFPQSEKIPNYTDIKVEPDTSISAPTAERLLANMNPIVNVRNLNKMGVMNCETVLSQPKVQQLIKSQEKFDVVINDLFHTDCFFAFAHKFKAISIGVSTSVLMPWANARMGNPENPSYIPQLFSTYSDKMNFYERMVNVLSKYLNKFMYYYNVDIPTNEIVRRHFGEDMPCLSDIVKNTSLILVNSHFSLNSPRPLVPGIVEVGGIHINPPKPLPKHIQEYLDGAHHGVIYFSLGSLLQAGMLPDDKRDAFLQAFAELPQRVLWKWEADKLPGQPKNVRTEKWCPQLDILRHPKIVAFISHGGLLGALEATYTGVPVIGIPFFGDQRTNLANMISRGTAIKLDYHNITKESILEAIRTVVDNSKYIENARHVARIFRDRPQSALDTAIFWTEYVIRHGGAPHMRSAAVELSLIQYLLLDVLAVIVAGLVFFVLLIVFLLRKLFTAIFGSKKPQTQSSKKKRQ